MTIASDVLATAAALSDTALIAQVHRLAGHERHALAELLAHLAELDQRRSLYARLGYGSLFSYCTRALGFSEDAAYNRIEAARACRRFPAILHRIAEGSVTLTAVRMLARHLTDQNHEEVLKAAMGRTKVEIEAIVARLAPQPDLPSSMRKLPTMTGAPVQDTAARSTSIPIVMTLPPAASTAPDGSPAAIASAPRAVVRETAPERYRVQFTIGRDTHEKLRRLQTLLAREIPNGDAAAIFDQALSLLLEKVERTKLAAVRQPRGPSRSGTTSTRHVPAEVRRAVWRRDAGRCAFVASGGNRCPERKYLEWHHVKAYALHGETSVDNVALRCRVHNAHEAELTFGPIRAERAKRLSFSSAPSPGDVGR